MSFPMAPSLSDISEATERSESVHAPSYEPVVMPETSRYSENYHGAGTIPSIPRASVFSSDTSYGEPLPPGQSTLKNLGLGLLLSPYEKSLPSLPRGSVTAMSVSVRSGPKTESTRGSIARSDVSKPSIAKSESSRHSISKPQSPRQSAARSESSRRSVAKSESSQHSLEKPEILDHESNSLHKSEPSAHSDAEFSPKRSSAKSESTLTSKPVPPVPVSPIPSLPPESLSASSVSTVSTHSSSHSSIPSAPHTSSTSSPTSISQPTSVSSVPTQSTLRTFEDVVDEVANSLAVRTKMNAETMPTPDHTKIGVCATMSRGGDQGFMETLAAKLHHLMALHSSYLFALIPIGPSPAPSHTILVFCGSPQRLVTKASILAGLRFKTRLAELQDTVGTWVGQLEPPAQLDVWDAHARHEAVLWDIVRKAANPASPTEPPPGSRSIENILAESRSRLDRLSPAEAFTEAMRDGILVDIRPAKQRAEHGTIPGALIIERNVLEWRFDPRCVDGRLPIADRYDLRIIVYCQEGYTSSLAAVALQDIGLLQATDIDGGFARWKQEGFPINGAPLDALTAEYQSVTSTSPRFGAVAGG